MSASATHPATPGGLPEECPDCGRTSYSLRVWGWCPWCDTDYKPQPRKQRPVMDAQAGELYL